MYLCEAQHIFLASVHLFWNFIDQLLDSLQAMQACHMVFCHGGSHLVSSILEVTIFGTWAAYQDAAWQLLHLGTCITKISNFEYSNVARYPPQSNFSASTGFLDHSLTPSRNNQPLGFNIKFSLQAATLFTW